MDAAPLVLASASPRRREMLERLGLSFEVLPAELDEATREGEDPEAYVLRIASGKADRIARARPEAVVLAADTAVVLDGEILGKPKDAADATTMLQRLSAREHLVLTAIAVARRQREPSPLVTRTKVVFRTLSDPEIRWYVQTGEPFDKAGGYGIQGLGGAFVKTLCGSASNVVGLPLAETLALLAEAGVRLPWNHR